MTQPCLVCIAFVLVGSLQQPMQVCKTGYLSDMVAGNLNLPRTAMLRIQCRDGFSLSVMHVLLTFFGNVVCC